MNKATRQYLVTQKQLMKLQNEFKDIDPTKVIEFGKTSSATQAQIDRLWALRDRLNINK